MSERFRVALVGCGFIGRVHAQAMARVDGLEVVALVDPDERAAATLAELIESELDRARPAIAATLGEAVAATSPDLVVICTPSGTHLDLATEAVESGAHVLIEKPLDVSVAHARRFRLLSETAVTRGQVIAVVSQHRFDPAAVVVAEATRTGGFGRLTSGLASVAWWRDQAYYDSGSWRGTWALDGGGAVMNQSVHAVDLLLHFLGTPVEVFAHTALLAHERIEVEDVAVATLRFASGALGVLHATTAAAPGLTMRVQVHGTEGSAVIDDDRLEFFASARLGEGDVSASLVAPSQLRRNPPDPDAFLQGHVRQYLDLVDALRTGRPPGVTVDQALLALAVVHSVYLSATLGRPVLVDEVLRGDHDGVRVATGTG